MTQQPASGRALRAAFTTFLPFIAAGCAAPVQEPVESASTRPLALLQEVFFDDFASGLDRWSEEGEGDWNTEPLISSAGYPSTGSGSPAAHSDGCSTTCALTLGAPVVLSDAVGGRVEFLRFVSRLLDPGEYLEVQAWNGSSWTRTHHWTDGAGDDSTWRTESIDLAPFAGAADFRVRFVTRQSSTLEHVHIDDVRISVETGGTGSCGDGVCTAPEETCSTCARDCGACPSDELFADAFESLSRWTESGEGDWNVESLHSGAAYPSDASGAPAAHSDACGSGCTLTLTDPIDLRGVSGAALRFLRFVDSALDSGEYLSVDLFDGSTWRTEFYWTDGRGDDDRWHVEVLDLSPYVGVANFRMRIQTRSSFSSEHVHVDDVRIARTPAPPSGFQVSRDNLRQHVEFLAAAPRAPGTSHLEAARQYCAERFAALGYTVEQHEFSSGGSTGRNVIGTRLGTSLASQIVMVSAHVDGVAGCQGADDNASGVAGVLESARVLALGSHARTIAVACWDLEETNLLGSRAFAARARSRGDDIRVNFVYEMIGFKSSAPNSQQIPGGAAFFGSLFPVQLQQLEANERRGDFIGVVADVPGFVTGAGGTRHMAELVLAASTIGLDTLAIDLTAQAADVFADALRSDHDSFWQEGYSALMITDTANFRNPNYHCVGGADAPATLDYAFAEQVAQATSLAALRALDD